MDIFRNFATINTYKYQYMRNMPIITKNLLIINTLAFLAMLLLKNIGVELNGLLGLHFFMASDFHIYQLVTYMFMHANFTHILFNMFALWMFGCVVERVWGPRKYLIYYLVCGIGAGLMQELAQFGQFYLMATDQFPDITLSQLGQLAANSDELLNRWTTVGASGAIYAIMLAFGLIFPEERIFIFPLPIPIKGKWFVVICAVIELLSAMSTSADGVAHLAHLGGMLFGYILIRYWRKHPTEGYGYANGHQFFDRMQNTWEKHKHKPSKQHENPDWDYNAHKQQEQEEIDHILDKIRKSGYDSLTKEEKQKLFDQSNR